MCSKINKKKIIVNVAIIALGIYGVIQVKRLFSSFSESDGIIRKASSEYTNLFPENKRKKLIVDWSYLSKVRNPISTFYYENYCVVIYKIDVIKNVSFPSMLKETMGSASLTINNVYAPYGKDRFVLTAKSGSPPIARNIYLTFDGDSLKTVRKNDSLACYYLKFDNLSMTYTNGTAVDILIEKNKSKYGFFNESNIPMNLVLLKRRNVVFFIMMSPYKKNGSISQDFLYKTLSDSI